MEENKQQFETDNDLLLTVKHGKDVLVNENCCTCITIMLNNEGKIMTSFLGGHNPYILRQLEKAQKVYFKSLKKALKADYNCDDECCCGKHCECEGEHHCGDENCHSEYCKCTPEHHCGCFDGKPCKCNCNGKCEEKKKSTKKAK